MPGPVALVYGDELMKHPLSDQHPLQPIVGEFHDPSAPLADEMIMVEPVPDRLESLEAFAEVVLDVLPPCGDQQAAIREIFVAKATANRGVAVRGIV